VDCGNPETPANGVKEDSTFTLNNTVQFKCQPDYKLAGFAVITCMSSGRWSGERPSCLDADECSQTPGCEQTCVNTPGSYRCTC
ncbi:hypothetical protein CAPTEDRAFT_49060, partial [Capitella teleta]